MPSPMTARCGTWSDTSCCRRPAGFVRDQPITVSDGPCIHDCAASRHATSSCWTCPSRSPCAPCSAVTPFRSAGIQSNRSLGWDCSRARGDTARSGARSNPGFVFHVGNAFDAGDRVVADVIAYPTMFTGGARAGSTRWAGWSAGRSTRSAGASTAACSTTRRKSSPASTNGTSRPRHRFLFHRVGAARRQHAVSRRHPHLPPTISRPANGRSTTSATGISPASSSSCPTAWARRQVGLMGFVLNVAEATTDFVILDGKPHRVGPGRHRPPAARNPAGFPRQLVRGLTPSANRILRLGLPDRRPVAPHNGGWRFADPDARCFRQ